MDDFYHLFEDGGRMLYEDGGGMLLDSSGVGAWVPEPSPSDEWSEQSPASGVWTVQ